MKSLWKLSLCLLLLSPSLQGQVPKVDTDMKPGVLKGRGIVSSGSQRLDVEYTSTVKEQGDAWVVTDEITSKAGKSTDTVTVEKGTLIVRKRSLNVQGLVGDLEIAGNKATGNAKVNGKDVPISISIDGPIFADGPAAAQSIALLPLAEGYTTTYRNLDVVGKRAVVMRLRVVGSETITVPGGRFETFKVEYAPEKGNTKSTLWVTKDTHRPVKAESISGPTKMTVELTQ